MPHNSAVMQAVESLDYRVTVGDVAAQSGLELAVAQQGLNALAADTQAHLQVSTPAKLPTSFPKAFVPFSAISTGDCVWRKPGRASGTSCSI